MDELNIITSLLKAVHFAADKHRSQRRKDVEASPYINHPIEVAELLARVGGATDLVLLQAAVLHDTIEDTKTSPEELEAVFGLEVRRVVEEVTDDKRLPKAERKRLQLASLPNPEATQTGRPAQVEAVFLSAKEIRLIATKRRVMEAARRAIHRARRAGAGRTAQKST